MVSNNEPLSSFVYHQKRFLDADSAYFDLIKKRISLRARAPGLLENCRRAKKERDASELRGSVCAALISNCESPNRTTGESDASSRVTFFSPSAFCKVRRRRSRRGGRHTFVGANK